MFEVRVGHVGLHGWPGPLREKRDAVICVITVPASMRRASEFSSARDAPWACRLGDQPDGLALLVVSCHTATSAAGKQLEPSPRSLEIVVRSQWRSGGDAAPMTRVAEQWELFMRRRLKRTILAASACLVSGDGGLGGHRGSEGRLGIVPLPRSPPGTPAGCSVGRKKADARGGAIGPPEGAELADVNRWWRVDQVGARSRLTARKRSW